MCPKCAAHSAKSSLYFVHNDQTTMGMHCIGNGWEISGRRNDLASFKKIYINFLVFLDNYYLASIFNYLKKKIFKFKKFSLDFLHF